MRPHTLTRPRRAALVLAASGLAVAALVSPGAAATTPGITRDMIITAAAGLRTNDPSAAQKDALDQIIRLHCGTEPTSESTSTWPAAAYVSGGIDGVLISTQSSEPTYKHCIFAALTTLDPEATLGGSVTITHRPITKDPDPPVTTLITEPLTGGVVVTPSVSGSYGDIRMEASGSTTRPVLDRTSTLVRDPKTRAQKRAAKKTYVKRIKAAKRAYGVALERAGRSSAKRAAAKKAYVDRRAVAKERYLRATNEVRLVVTTRTVQESKPATAIAQVYSLIRFG